MACTSAEVVWSNFNFIEHIFHLFHGYTTLKFFSSDAEQTLDKSWLLYFKFVQFIPWLLHFHIKSKFPASLVNGLVKRVLITAFGNGKDSFLVHSNAIISVVFIRFWLDSAYNLHLISVDFDRPQIGWVWCLVFTFTDFQINRVSHETLIRGCEFSWLLYTRKSKP